MVRECGGADSIPSRTARHSRPAADDRTGVRPPPRPPPPANLGPRPARSRIDRDRVGVSPDSPAPSNGNPDLRPAAAAGGPARMAASGSCGSDPDADRARTSEAGDAGVEVTGGTGTSDRAAAALRPIPPLLRCGSGEGCFEAGDASAGRLGPTGSGGGNIGSRDRGAEPVDRLGGLLYRGRPAGGRPTPSAPPAAAGPLCVRTFGSDSTGEASQSNRRRGPRPRPPRAGGPDEARIDGDPARRVRRPRRGLRTAADRSPPASRKVENALG